MHQLKSYAAQYGIMLDEIQLDMFACYEKHLLEWNQRMNLTAITKHEEVVVKHFLDSLLLLDAVDIPSGAKVMDVGTGAGFPGVPIKIVRPDIELTLLDSLQKRVRYLTELSAKLVQRNTVLHGRAEELGHAPDLREKFDIVTARAVASLPVLCEYCLPFVKPGGIFAALKGPEVECELASADSAVKTLGADTPLVKQYELPMENKRSIIIIEKISQTSPKYPRNAGKITKMPL